jgi:hypothetical protein
MTKGLLAAAVAWVIGVEIVAWWCLSVSALGGAGFWPAVLELVTPCSVLVGVMVGRLAQLGWFSGRRREVGRKSGQKNGVRPKATPNFDREQ